MVASANAVRAKYAANARIHADAVNLFADGVLEGNLYGTPPTPVVISLTETLPAYDVRQRRQRGDVGAGLGPIRFS